MINRQVCLQAFIYEPQHDARALLEVVKFLYYLKIILSKIIGIYLADKCPGLLFLNFLDLPMQASVCDHSLQKFSVSKRPIVFN